MNSANLSYIRRVFPLRRIALLLLLTAFATTAGTQLYTLLGKNIEVYDNGTKMVATTMGYDVQQALEQLGITVGEADFIDQPPTNLLSGGTSLNTVTIKRAVPLTVTADGETRKIMSWRGTVAEVIGDQGLLLGEFDRLDGISGDASVAEGMNIRLIRVKHETITESEVIPYDVTETANNTMNEGETKVLQAGVDGILNRYFQIVYEDGQAVARTFLEEKIALQPVQQLVEYGTVKNFTNSRGDLVRYRKIMDMQATAYTASFSDTGKSPGDYGFGVTRTGITAREGVIAVDPTVIPLGTRVYVEVPGSAPDYGFAIAADIGSAIKGKLIDLYFDTTYTAQQWGRRSVRVYILNEQNDTRWTTNDTPWQN